MLQIICPSCKKQLQLAAEKIPHDKTRAMIKCPGCQKIITFDIPRKQAKPEAIAPEDHTEISTSNVSSSLIKSRHRLVEKSTGMVFKLIEGINVLGRKGSPAIENGDKYISRKHCTIEIKILNGSQIAVLYDDGSLNENGEPSTNGTFYRGTRLTKFDKFVLVDGVELKLGLTEFIYHR